jgi:hypothetical protein
MDGAGPKTPKTPRLLTSVNLFVTLREISARASSFFLTL